jgi:hypothetical protein
MGMAGMFSDMRKLERITIGPNFSFDGDGTLAARANFYTPNPEYISDTNGYWNNITTGERYLPSEVPNRTAATYSCVYFDTFVKNTTL